MTARDEILCVGRIYVDVVLAGLEALPKIGREQYARDITIVPGGGAYITAAHLRALGRNVRLASALGDDPLSASLAASIRNDGFDTDLIDRFAGGPQLTVALAVGDDRAFTTHRAGPSAPAGLRARLAGGGVRHVHVGELSTLSDLRWLPQFCRKNSITLSVDVSWDDEIFRDPTALDLAAGVDLVMPNVAEAAALTGIDASRRAEMLSAFAARGTTVALKCGADGAMYARGEFVADAGAIPGTVVDATGAGDAFDAGFIDAWLDGSPAETCLARAVACGTYATRQIGGATKLPTPEAIASMARGVIVRTQRLSIEA